MSELFDENERYTKQALKINSEIEAALLPVFNKYRCYPAREIAHLMIHTVLDFELESVLSQELKSNDHHKG